MNTDKTDANYANYQQRTQGTQRHCCLPKAEGHGYWSHFVWKNSR